MEFSRQEYWSGVAFPSPGDLPDPEIEPVSHALAGGFFTREAYLASEAGQKAKKKVLMEKFLVVKVFHLCPTLCDHMDYTVHGIL